MSEPQINFNDFAKIGAKAVSPDRRAQIAVNIDLLFETLSEFKRIEDACTPVNEERIKSAFFAFLKGNGFEMAVHDLKALLEEKSGDRRYREDGTVSWYHELSPILMMLSLVRLGKDKGGIDYDAIAKTGGLETAIRTHLRHDSLEDTGISVDDLKAQKNTSLDAVLEFYKATMTEEELATWKATEQARNRIYRENIILMSRKIAETDENGKPVILPSGKIKKHNYYERVQDYIYNMIESESANPVVYLLKQGDGCHNLATLIGSPKFTAERRIKYCNEREDMYGSRYGFTDDAMEKWQDFSRAFSRMDHMMGAVLYLNIDYIIYVDEAQPDKFKEGQRIYPPQLGRYLNKALEIQVPEFANPLHLFLRSLAKEAKTNPKASRYLESIMPKLQQRGRARHFPYLFEGQVMSRKPANANSPTPNA